MRSNYVTFNCSDIPGTLGCYRKGECLCLQGEDCCALTGDKSLSNPHPIGMQAPNGMICKMALFCCTCGLKAPTVCCLGKGACLCGKCGCAFPFDSETVKEPLCAIYGLRILPAPMGCGMPFNSGGSTDNAMIAR